MRHEVELLQTTFDNKERLLREELQLKDRRLVSIQNKLNLTDNFIKISDMWRSAVKDLSLQIIQLCANSNNLPIIPTESFGYGFREYYLVIYTAISTLLYALHQKIF